MENLIDQITRIQVRGEAGTAINREVLDGALESMSLLSAPMLTTSQVFQEYAAMSVAAQLMGKAMAELPEQTTGIETAERLNQIIVQAGAVIRRARKLLVSNKVAAK